MANAIQICEQPNGSISKNTVFVSGPLVTLTDTNTSQTLTNKTLTSPTITGPTLSNSTVTVTVQTLAGTGTNFATANAITAVSGSLIFTTGGNNSVGIALPVAAAGMYYTIKNDDAANGIQKIYPQVNSSINGTANSALSMAANTMATFFAVNSTAWVTNKIPC